MNKTELLTFIDKQWAATIQYTIKECCKLFDITNEELPTNPEHKGWMLGITEGINRAYSNLYRKIADDEQM